MTVVNGKQFDTKVSILVNVQSSVIGVIPRAAISESRYLVTKA